MIRDRLDSWRGRGPVVPVIPLIGANGHMGPVRRGLTLATLAPHIERAFAGRKVPAVALAVNSPGGSPVQSALIHDRIRALSGEKGIPVRAFIEDVGASGGYWLACAGDTIYANENSIVGSIGVISASFGFSEAIARLGIERRVHTAGENKGMLDPFRPERPRDIKRLREIQAEMHGNFSALVRDRRGGRLTGPEKELFSGAFWTGRTARELGLVDGIGDMRQVMRAEFGDKVRFRVLGERRGTLRRRLGLADGDAGALSGDFASGALAALEERSLWARFGL